MSASSFPLPGPAPLNHVFLRQLTDLACLGFASKQQQGQQIARAQPQKALKAEAYTMAAGSHAAEWKVPPEQDGWVLSHDALRLDLADLQRLLDALEAQAAAGRPLQHAQLDAAAAAWRHFEHMLAVHHDTEEELYFPLLRTRFEVPAKQKADHRRIVGLMQECCAQVATLQAVSVAGAAAELAALKVPFGQLRRLCEEHFREEEAETLPLIRANFAPEEVTPTAKRIAKAYALLDMGNYLRPMSPAQRTAWMCRVGMPFFIQWLMLLQVWRYDRAVVQPLERAVQQAQGQQ